MSAECHPRVLFVTPHAFNHVTGGGITFSNLFRGWPADRLATVHSDPEPTTDDVCRQYYVLGAAELDYIWPLSWLRRRWRQPGPPPTGTASSSPGGEPGRLRAMAMAVLGDPPPRRARLTRELEQWIAAFDPQVLYTILGDNGMMDLVEAIRRRFGLPLVVHVMDDWPAAAYRTGMLGPAMRRGMERRLDRLLATATHRFAISPAMADAYRTRYGRPFEVFQNTIDVAARTAIARPAPTVGETAEILYVGSIFPNAQLDSLVDCARAVVRLANDGARVRLVISSLSGHAERHRHRFPDHPAVRIEPTIEDDDVFFRRIADAGLLLLPVNFDADSVRFIRYSMPTKVPAYLVSGTPILAYGPAETAQIAYARDAGWARVVDERGVEGLAAAMRDLLTDMTLRRQLVQAAQETARRSHDVRRVRRRFQALIADAADTEGVAACGRSPEHAKP